MDFEKASFSIDSPITDAEALALQPMSLAFIGDGVQSLYVRTRFTVGSTEKTGSLHKKVTQIVKAVSQADAVNSLLPLFNEVEKDVFRRARNSKILTSAKHAEIGEYRRASGFEAVIGYLFLTGRNDRLYDFLNRAFALEIVAENQNAIKSNFGKVDDIADDNPTAIQSEETK